MISEEENRRLTQVGPETPMGSLLRWYWHPVAPASELEASSCLAARLLGEDLAVFRTPDGSVGALRRACAHRGGDLAAGIVEEYGLRCPVHGWLYGFDGRCLDQPLEPEPFCDEIRLPNYPAASLAGLIWVYLGPAPAPPLPNWEPFSWEDALVQIALAKLPCNWLQCQESAVEPMNFAAGRGDRPAGLKSVLAAASEPDRLAIDEFEYGFRLSLTGASDDGAEASDDVARICLWPNAAVVGDDRSCRFEWRVPLDDENTLIVARFADRPAPGASLPAGPRSYHWYAPLGDLQAGEPLLSHVLNREFALWMSQGRVLDRTKEHLTASDKGVALLRARYMSQMDLVADGGQPKAVIRAGRETDRLSLPLPSGRNGASLRRVAGRYDHDEEITFDLIAGQPPEAAAAYRQVVASWLESDAPTE